MSRGIRAIHLALALMLMLASPVGAVQSTNHVSVASSTLTQYLWVNWNSQTCSSSSGLPGATVYQVYRTDVRWWRSSTTDRFVHDARVKITGVGPDCGRVFRTNGFQPAGFRPCWGTACPSGSTSLNWTKTYVYSFSWPYVGIDTINGGHNVGAGVKSRVENRSGTILARPCSRVNLINFFECSEF